jgi:TonB family protein
MTTMTLDLPSLPARRPRAGTRGALLLASALAHAALFAALRAGDARRAAPPAPTLVTINVAPLPPPTAAAPPPAARTEAPPPRPIARAPRTLARAPRAVPAPAPEAAPPPATAPPPEPIADLTGVTLTNDGAGPGWSSAVGNGAVMTGPIGAVARRRVAPAGIGDGAAGAGGPPLVPLADLRRRPEPPDLDGPLARNYPEEARRAGLTGSAIVRARILPDGALDRTRVAFASAPAFGDACLRTLAGSRWTAPLDGGGRPCATEIRYTCRFELGR